MVDLGPLLVGGDVGKVSDHDDGLLLAVHGRLQVVGRLAVLSICTDMSKKSKDRLRDTM